MQKIDAKVKVKDSSADKKVIGEQSYQKVVFEIPKDTAADQLLQQALEFMGKEAGKEGNAVLELLGHVTYSFDLGKRSKIRQVILDSIQGPDKAIDKAVDNILRAKTAMGQPITKDEARALLGVS